MKKIFASSFDGTIYFYKAEEDRKLPAEYVEKIHEYQAGGNIFGLCTGRQVGELKPIISGHIDPDFYITSCGANIVDYHLHEIRKKGLDPNVVDVILRYYGTDRFDFTMDVEGEVCVFHEMDVPGDYHLVTGVDDAPRGRIHQLRIKTGTAEEAIAVEEEINLWYGDAVNAFRNMEWIDIAPRGCAKSEAVNYMRDYIGQVYGDVRLYGIGMFMSDLPLLAVSDVSYTFPDAAQGLQNRVTKVVPTLLDALEDSMSEQA